MSAPNRKGMGLGDALLVWLAIGFIVVFGGGTYAAAHLGLLDGRHRRTARTPD